eukprot:7436350-Pyramimonas_sp.AAC.1
MQAQVAHAASTFLAQDNQLLRQYIESFRQLLARPVQATERRADSLHDVVAPIRRERDRQGAYQQKMRQQIDQMRETLALAEAQAPIKDLASLADWDRAIDQTILTIGAQRPIALGVLLNDLQEWIASANLDTDAVELCGVEPARRFILQVKGDRVLAVSPALAL